MGYAGEPPTVSIAIDNSITPFSVLDPEPEEFLPKLKSAEAPTFLKLKLPLISLSNAFSFTAVVASCL